MAQKRGNQLWITCGCGCLVVVALAIGGMIAAGYLGVSGFESYLTDLKDPAARTARAAEILGASRLPEGYVGQLFVSIPWFFDLVILSDGEPMVIADEADADLDAATVGDNLFLYFKIRSDEADDEDIDRMLRGERTSDGVQADIGIELDPDEELGRGAFELEPQSLRWVAHRGEIELAHEDLQGIYSRVIIDCPRDARTRVAVWFRRDAEEAAAAAAGLAGSAAGLAGTPDDEVALKELMGHFNLCVE